VSELLWWWTGGGRGTSASFCAGCAVEVEELAVESDTVVGWY